MEGAGDPTYLTYYVMDWKKTEQTQSEDYCSVCGGCMLKVKSIRSGKGVYYEGRVCHTCKTLFWIRKD